MPNPKYLLYFDGATSGGNPGKGGCGAYWHKNAYSSGGQLSNDSDQIYKEHRVSRKLGHMTSNAAEYNGLILGLCDILKEYPVTTFDLMIFGDSELIIRQLSGEYEVNSPMLKVYFQIAQGLLKRIKGKVLLSHVPRDENQIADKLAKEAAKWTELDVDEYILFYPSLMNLYDLTCQGSQGSQGSQHHHLMAGSDPLTAGDSKEFIFDATTILEIFGKDSLQTLKDPGRTTILNGKVAMTILGVLNRPIHCSIDLKFDDGTQIEVDLEDVVVVDFLPYDAQISLKHPMMKQALSDQANDRPFLLGNRLGHSFASSSLNGRFRDHRYWRNDGTLFVCTGL